MRPTSTMTVRWFACGLLIAGLVACGRGAGGPSPSASDVPDVARVVCENKGTNLVTPTVRPQPDGVHISIEDRTGQDVTFVVGDLGGDNASGEQVWPIPPGTAQVGCWGMEPEPDLAEMEVVDPEGLYVSSELDCAEAVGGSGAAGVSSSSGGSYGEPPEGDPRDPVVIAREFFEDAFGPLGPEDRVEPAGYPKAEIRQVRLVRAARTVAVADYADASFAGGEEGSGWISEGYQACSDA
jgi:hypothetical protein